MTFYLTVITIEFNFALLFIDWIAYPADGQKIVEARQRYTATT